MELSRDKIKEIINDDWLLMDDCEGNKNCDVVKELARIALASLEAEAVAYIIQDAQARGLGRPGFLSFDASISDEDINEYEISVTPLYTAPQLPQPAVAVPLAIHDEDFEKALSVLNDTLDDCGDSERGLLLALDKAGIEVRSDACRAAMLQGKSEQPQNAQQNIPENIPGGNSPGTPDSWISCSDRMPEMGERQCYALAADFKNNYPPHIPNTQVGVYGDWFNDGDPTWVDGDGEDLYLKEVTHWIPLPEPPQEVK